MFRSFSFFSVWRVVVVLSLRGEDKPLGTGEDKILAVVPRFFFLMLVFEPYNRLQALIRHIDNKTLQFSLANWFVGS